MKTFALTLLSGLLLAMPAHAQERISHGRFADVTLYRPAGEVRAFVLFLSGESGWNQSVVSMARALVDQGAMVAGISTPQLIANLETDRDDCVFPAGDLENLSHYLQGYAQLPTYYTPMLVGYSSGATVAYAMIAQAPAGTFSAALSLDFCPYLNLKKTLCKGEGVQFTQRQDAGVDLQPAPRLPVPWVALQGDRDQVCDAQAVQAFLSHVPDATLVTLPKVDHGYSDARNWMPQFVAAYRSLNQQRTATLPAPPSLADLPLIEVPATAGSGETFAVLLSGDGGWAGLDKNLAANLAAHGVPVVGLDSLRYFWRARTPEGLAGDLDRVLRFYAAHWHKSRVLLIGYSQGADVLPFAVNRLRAASKSLLAQIVLLGLGEQASFEFHLDNWLGADRGGAPILPEVAKLSAATALCVYGEDEHDSLCPRIPAGHVRLLTLPGGHHFDGAYDKLGELILAHAKAR